MIDSGREQHKYNVRERFPGTACKYARLMDVDSCAGLIPAWVSSMANATQAPDRVRNVGDGCNFGAIPLCFH